MPVPAGMVLRLGWAVLARQKLDFGQFSRQLLPRLSPPLRLLGSEYIPAAVPCVITVNHYARYGFQAWWLSVLISAALAAPVHWIMTAEWTNPNPWKSWWWSPLTRWFFQRLADVFDFTTMPPMPPDPRQAMQRAAAVRNALRLIRERQESGGSFPVVIGLAPEGGDMPDGLISMPPAGAGRFILLMVEMGLIVHPVSVYIDQTGLCLRFGKPYLPVVRQGLSRDELDRDVRWQVMQEIANLAPPELRGEFSSDLDQS